MTSLGVIDERAGNTLPEKCASCGALQRAICGHLEGASLTRLSRVTRTQIVKRGQSILWQAEEAPAVGVVQSGMLKLTMSLEDGREQTVGLAMSGDFVGRPMAAMSAHTVTAVTDAAICVVSRPVFEALEHELPDIEHALVKQSFDELDRARTWLLLLGRKSSKERVATFLKDLAEKHRGQAGAIPLPLTRQEMAELLGLTIETVSRNLSALKRAGIITLTSMRSFVIRQPEELARIAG